MQHCIVIWKEGENTDFLFELLFHVVKNMLKLLERARPNGPTGNKNNNYITLYVSWEWRPFSLALSGTKQRGRANEAACEAKRLWMFVPLVAIIVQKWARWAWLFAIKWGWHSYTKRLKSCTLPARNLAKEDIHVELSHLKTAVLAAHFWGVAQKKTSNSHVLLS